MNSNGCINLIIGPMFSRKCLGKNTPVLLFDNTIKFVQDITTNDVLMGDDSTQRRVLCTVNGTDELYNVKQSNGDDYVVNSEHVLTLIFTGSVSVNYNTDKQEWSVTWFENDNLTYRCYYDYHYHVKTDAEYMAKQFAVKLSTRANVNKYGDTIDIKLSEYNKKSKKWKKYWKGFRLPTRFSTQHSQLDPVLLADWLMSDSTDIPDTLLKYEKLKYTKYIPSEYKYSNRGVRSKLFVRLCHTIDINSREITFPTEELTTDFIFIAESIGYNVKRMGYNYVRVIVKTLDRTTGDIVDKIIISDLEITPIGKDQYFGFELLGTNGRFMLGDHTITHNTSTMCDAVERYHIAQRNCVLIKYDKDTRYDNISIKNLVSHAGREFDCVKTIITDNLTEIKNQLMNYDVIGVDEIQFYPDASDVIQYLANNGKIVICAGLDGDYNAKIFPRISELIPLAENITKLKAVCMYCHKDASYTDRISCDTEVEVIGGIEKYKAVCRNCKWNIKKDN